MGYWTIIVAGQSLPVAIGDILARGVLVIGFMLLVFAVIVFQFVKARELYGSGDSPDPNDLINCSSCGARVSADTATCEYCGEPIDR